MKHPFKPLQDLQVSVFVSQISVRRSVVVIAITILLAISDFCQCGRM